MKLATARGGPRLSLFTHQFVNAVHVKLNGLPMGPTVQTRSGISPDRQRIAAGNIAAPGGLPPMPRWGGGGLNLLFIPHYVYTVNIIIRCPAEERTWRGNPIPISKTAS